MKTGWVFSRGWGKFHWLDRKRGTKLVVTIRDSFSVAGEREGAQ